MDLEDIARYGTRTLLRSLHVYPFCFHTKPLSIFLQPSGDPYRARSFRHFIDAYIDYLRSERNRIFDSVK